MFDRRVGELERELAPIDASPSLVLDPGAAAILTDSPQAWQLPLADSADVSDAFRQLLSHHLEAKYRPLVMLWSDGSAVIEPCCLVVKGLPGPDFYPALLDGSWANHRWRSVQGVVSQDTLPGTLLVDEAGPGVFPLGGGVGHGTGAWQQRGRGSSTVPKQDSGRCRRHGWAQSGRRRQPDGVRRSCRLPARWNVRRSHRCRQAAPAAGQRPSREDRRGGPLPPQRQHCSHRCSPRRPAGCAVGGTPARIAGGTARWSG